MTDNNKEVLVGRTLGELSSLIYQFLSREQVKVIVTGKRMEEVGLVSLLYSKPIKSRKNAIIFR